MRFANDHFMVQFHRRSGIFSMQGYGVDILHKGGVQEFVDSSTWDKGTGSAASLAGDEFRTRAHFIQTMSEAVISSGDQLCIVAGTLQSRVGNVSGLRFVNRYQFYDDRPYFRVECDRVFTQEYPKVWDPSFCFLSPAHFRFGQQYISECREKHQPYQVREEGGLWKDGPSPENDYHRVDLPGRLRTFPVSTGWACCMGEGVGFGVVLLDYTPVGTGRLNLTHPRATSRQQFSEIEFTWAGHQKPKGRRETGVFLVMPCRSPDEVKAVWEEQQEGAK